VRPISLLYYADNEMKYVMFRRIHERLRRDPRFSLTFTGDYRQSGRCAELYRNAGAGDVRIRHKMMARFLRYDLYVSSGGPSPSTWAKRKVMIFHGSSPKNAFVRSAMRYDRCFVHGEYMRRRIIETGGLAADDPRLVLVGFPKLDCLVDGSLDSAAIRANYGIDPSRPTVTYAPTHEGAAQSSISLAGRQIVATLADMGVNVLVKLHTRLCDPSRNKVDWRAQAESWKRPNVHIVQGHDSCEALCVTDVLVSDLSSIASEFTVLDRPIVYYDVPEMIAELQRRGRRIDSDPWGRSAGDVVGDCAGLRSVVERALVDPSRKSETRRAMASDLFYRPGTATDRAVAGLCECVGLDPLPAVGEEKKLQP
jgi:hypothetical protein